jgi:hypothetical protein
MIESCSIYRTTTICQRTVSFVNAANTIDGRLACATIAEYCQHCQSWFVMMMFSNPSLSLGCKLNLKDIALRARNAEYNPKRFAAVIMRIREPRTTALIFR